jgi:hypothetical protein
MVAMGLPLEFQQIMGAAAQKICAIQVHPRAFDA